MKVYLAGPEVFLDNASEVLNRKVELARAAGFDPVAPGNLVIPPTPTARQFGENIYLADKQLMLSADAIIANLTPFRGLHADAGTIFELGFMCGRGKPAFAYSNVTATYYERLLDYYGGQVTRSPNGQMRGRDGACSSKTSG